MEPLLSEPEELRVLHVDDREPFLDVAARYLNQEATEVTVVTETDPHSGLDYVVENRVDCIVSDYDMPEMNGLAFLSEVREHDTETPFILFTGKGSEQVAARAIEAGVDSYLQKKGDKAQFSVLANRIETLVDQAWAKRRARKMEQTYELIARTATDAFWVRNVETNETLYSEGIRQFGYEPGLRDDGFEWWVERLHPKDRQEARDRETLQREGAPQGLDDRSGDFTEFTHHYRWQTASGEYVPCTTRGIVRFENDDPVEMVGAMTRRNERTGTDF